MSGTRTEDISVECYAGYRADETPRRFRLGGRTFDVVEVLDCWLAPEHRYFKCRVAGGDTYLLGHDVTNDRWRLVLYQRAPEASRER
jgi:hypothetical protein